MRGTCAFVPGPKMPGHGLHAILVHGTFAADATWPDHPSPFAQAMATLDPAGVRLSRFNWSGGNTHRARVEGADALRAVLRAQVEDAPGVSILLVGHSHGGNVCLAAADAIPDANAAGVVTLATPFFHVRKRSTFALHTLFAALLVFVMVYFFSTVASWFYEWSAPWHAATCGTWCQWLRGTSIMKGFNLVSGVASALIVLLVLFAVGFFATWGLIDNVEERQQERYEEWAAMRPAHVPTLSIWFWPDEALWGLRAFRAIPDMTHRLADLFHRGVVPIILIGSLVGAAVMTYAQIYYAVAPPGGPRQAATFGLAAISQGSLVASCGMVLAWGFGVLPAALNQVWGNGTMSLWSHFLLDIHIERRPAIDTGLAEGHEFPIASSGFFSRLLACIPYPIIHSRVYLDARTRGVIAQWFIRRKATRDGGPSAVKLV